MIASLRGKVLVHRPDSVVIECGGVGYRLAVSAHTAQKVAAEESKKMYQQQLSAAGYGEITTEIVGPPAPPFYFAEDYHQQYLDKIPFGYCPNHATGVRLPEGFTVTASQTPFRVFCKKTSNAIGWAAGPEV